ncbi:YdaS family helix-turn-helix protein [Sessilibacter sp. MAH2]
MSRYALETAILKAGGQTQLARKINLAIDLMIKNGCYKDERPPLKVKQNNIWKWLNDYKGPIPPAEYVVPIEFAVGIPREKLRKDLYLTIIDTKIKY